MWLIDLIIDSTEGNVGIPIGNQTSQLFALLYLDGLDHFVKEKLGIKYYGRYMDDFFLIHHDKAYLQECRKQIEAFVQARGLSLNAKTNIFPLKHGVDFLGFHTYFDRKRRGDPQGAPPEQEQYEAEVEEISRHSRGGTDRRKDR